MKELFDNLMNLCETCDVGKFFFKDYTSAHGSVLRVFSYNYASYTDWLNPDALECRGIVFEMDGDEPARIVARPMEKFFNLNETPFTMNLDLSQIEFAMSKADGSLVSSCIVDSQLVLKSKTSFISEQAIAATGLLHTLKYESLLEAVREVTEAGYTCNFEYVSPNNRIVLQYQEPELILLNIRNNETGEYVEQSEIHKSPAFRPFMINSFVTSEPEAWVDEVRKLVGIEGYVCRMADGLHFKLKTDWYCALHRTKDSITKNETLFGSIVNGAADDLKGMFSTDPWALEKIDAFEAVYQDFVKTSLEKIIELHTQYRSLERKDYVGKVQAALGKGVQQNLFSVLMNFYGRDIDFSTIVDFINKIFMKNNKSLTPKAYAKEVELVTE